MKIYLCCIGLWLNMGLCHAQNPKIGLVNMNVALEALPEKDSLEQLVKWFENTYEKGFEIKQNIIHQYYEKAMECKIHIDYFGELSIIKQKEQEDKLQFMQEELLQLANNSALSTHTIDSTFQNYMHLQIEWASQQVAKKQDYQLIIKDTICLFHDPALDITALIITALEDREQTIIQKQLRDFQKQVYLSIQKEFRIDYEEFFLFSYQMLRLF